MTSTNTQQSPRSRSLIVLLGLVLLCYGVAAVGALSTAPSIPTWYATLAKPAFNPPNWIFAPVWTMLYGFMAIAAWLVWRTPKIAPGAESRSSGLVLFAVQLILNALWTPVFFSFHRILAALILICLLWIAILLTTICFWRVQRIAAALMVLYLLWVSFATALNYQIYRLN